MTLRACVRLLLLLLVVQAMAAPAVAQDHGAAPPTAAGAQPAHPEAAAGEHGEEGGILSTIARLVNFAILVGVLVYFLKTPAASYLAGRSAQIRQDLVAAAELRKTATAQLEEIQRRLQTLPAELEALKARGAEDVRAEQARIAQAAAAERDRLLAQAEREIQTHLRIARRELTQHAAQLAVDVATERIKRTMTPEDQLRLVDRYTTQLREAR